MSLRHRHEGKGLPRLEPVSGEVQRCPDQPGRVAVPGGFDVIVLEARRGIRNLADQRAARSVLRLRSMTRLP